MLAPLLLLSALGTNEFGTKFLAENGKKSRVTTLPSGLQYRVVTSGEGKEHPLPDTDCTCHYEGRVAQNFPDGKTFDSSYDRNEPTNFAPNQVIAGWTEAMQLMVAGDKWELFIPSNLGYGDSGQGPDIGGGDCLVFTLQLIKLNGPGKALTADELATQRTNVANEARRHPHKLDEATQRERKQALLLKQARKAQGGGQGGRGTAQGELRRRKRRAH